MQLQSTEPRMIDRQAGKESQGPDFLSSNQDDLRASHTSDEKVLKYGPKCAGLLLAPW